MKSKDGWYTRWSYEYDRGGQFSKIPSRDRFPNGNADMTGVEPSIDRRFPWMIGCTVLCSAWLLFQIQPMAAKRILPWFGGGPAVWTTAMLFFQVLLLAGYLYAHLSVGLLPTRAQFILHIVLMSFACVVVFVTGVVVGDNSKPSNFDHPQVDIVLLLSKSVGMPFLVLASTAPLVQAWLGGDTKGRSMYRLYAISNIGSLAALVSYPLIIEPSIGLRTQSILWSTLFLLFAVLCTASSWNVLTGTAQVSVDNVRFDGESKKRIPSKSSRHFGGSASDGTFDSHTSVLSRVLWIALPACASAMLLAVTNYICQDIAPVPLLWIAPLVVYLLTFILAFENDRWYMRWPAMVGLAVLSFASSGAWGAESSTSFEYQVTIQIALLFVTGLVCHGELARLRPSQQHLTAYYLSLAVGGACGGILIAVVAPRIFADYRELPLTTLAAWLLSICILATDSGSKFYRGRLLGGWVVIIALWCALALIARTGYLTTREYVIAMNRNFFGTLKVQDGELGDTGLRYRRMLNGRISHGSQLIDTAYRREPTQYFDHASGVGQLLDSLKSDHPKHVGIIGLGVGTLAAYANPGDEFTFYEINPAVIEFAEEYFSFLADARARGAKIGIIGGDGRLALERGPNHQFDALVVDAFSGDAIPIHLLTVQAFDVYLRQLRSSTGVLAVHVSNRNLNLVPVVSSAAATFQHQVRLVERVSDPAKAVLGSKWMLLHPSDRGIVEPNVGAAVEPPLNKQDIAWTDDYSSLSRVLKIGSR